MSSDLDPTGSTTAGPAAEEEVGASLPATTHAAGDDVEPLDDAEPLGEEIEPPSARRRAGRRPIDRGLLAASAVIAVGLVLIGYGLMVSVTGDERTNLPDEIERISPVPDAVQVLSQSNVVVDLAEGFTGYLVIDDVEIETVDLGEIGSIEVEPGRQVEIPPVTVYEPGNATLTFTPSENAVIDEFASGVHRVQVVYWRIEDGPSRPRSYTWTFNVI